MSSPLHLFISYAQEDEPFFRELDAHLAQIRRDLRIRDWHPGMIEPGQDRRRETERYIESAELIVLLVSADFLHRCEAEMTRTLERARAGHARLVPVIVRPCDWRHAPFGGLVALPSEARPVTDWPSRDDAWIDVVRGLRSIATAEARRVPRYPDEETRLLSAQLEHARARRERLRRYDQATAEIDREILDLRRRLREGGRLRAGDALGERGRHVLLEQVGRGGFSLVWRARDRERDDQVAIKVLHPSHAGDAGRLERFLRGARAMAALEHEAVARILEPPAVDDGYHYFVMEFLAGGDLRRAVHRKAVSRDDVLRIILTAGEALALAHERGYVHRDVKPANILLDDRGQPKLTDFDLVIGRDTTGGTGTGPLGTYIYAAPELLASPHDADARADVYGLAMTAVFALYGEDLPVSVVRSVAPLVDGLACAHAVRGVLKRALHWDRRARHPHARAFCEELRRAAARITLYPPRSGAAPLAQDLSRRSLRGQDLSGADLSGRRLVVADLTGARLCDANLSGADLTGARAAGADLSRADLSYARLLGADLSGARLEGARLREAKLVGAQIDAGALEGCDLFGAALPSLTSEAAPMVALASECNAVAYSPDGGLLASGHADGSVRIWDAPAGSARRIFAGHRAAVTSMAFSPDGRLLASGSLDATVRLWDLSTGQEQRVLRRHARAVTSVAFSRLYWATLATGSDDGTVRLWVASTGAEIRALRPSAPVTAVALSPDGATLAAATAAGSVWLWDVGATEPRRVLGAGARVRSLAFSADGALLAAALDSGAALVWDASTGAPRRAPSSPWGGPVTSVAFSPDGALLAGGSEDGTVRLCDTATGADLRALRGHRGPIRGVAFHPDGQRLVTGSDDQTLRLWDASDGAERRVLATGHASSLLGLSLHPRGTVIAVSSAEGTIRLWNVARATERRVLPVDQGPALGLAFSPSGDLLAAGAKGGVVWLWERRSGGRLDFGPERELEQWRPRALGSCGAPVASVAFEPRGAALASASEDGLIRVWDLREGEARHVPTGHADAARSVAFSPAGDLLASGGRDRTARVWDPATGALVGLLADHGAPVLGVAFDPRGATLASASADGVVRLWDVASGAVRHVLEGHEGAVVSVAFSPDGALLATASDDRTVRLWDAATGGALRGLREAHAACVISVAFSPDGALLASASLDGAIRLWSPASGRCRAAFLSLERGWVAFTPDGRFRLNGDTAGAFWHAIGLCRFEPEELDDHLQRPLLINASIPLF